jgi:hypothetical protein
MSEIKIATLSTNTAREIYFAIYSTVDIPIIKIPYAVKKKSGGIQLGSTISLAFKDGHEHNINLMSEKEKAENFHCWMHSYTGKEIVKMFGIAKGII